MSATYLLVVLAGHVVLLLWGARMVQTGIVRAYGSELRRVLGAGLNSRWLAMLAGIGVTALLQSSTATALMTTSFAADGLVALVPALAVMLGANVGTALMVKLLTFDISWLSPVLLIAGYIGFKRGSGSSRKGRLQNLGRVGMGLGLMLLALRLLVEAMRPAEAAPILRELLEALTSEPVLDVLLAAVLTWAAHSSVAVLLMIVPLASTGVVPPVAALALVLGANLGSAVSPVLEAGGPSAAGKRLPVGNLAFRAVGCVVALPFLAPIAGALTALSGDAGAQAVYFHILLNVVLAIGFIGLLDPAAALLVRLLPDAARGPDPGQPHYLDPAALETPYLALANAAREVLRMGDLVETMLRRSLEALLDGRRDAADETVRLARALDALGEDVKAYLTRIAAEPLAERDARRCAAILEFAVNLGHVGAIAERSLVDSARRLHKRHLSLSAADRADLVAFHAEVLEDLVLALSTLMAEDARGAQQLIDAKRRLSERERAAAAAHLARLSPDRPDALECSTLHLGVLRDLKRINSLLSSVGYAVLDRADPEPATEA
jgi:phosphate:Na+ symporter